jgi:hypothetical protein
MNYWKRTPACLICYVIVEQMFPHFFRGSTTPSGPGNPHCRGFMITLRHKTLSRTHLDRVISPKHILPPENTQHCQHTDIHAPGGI